MVQQIFILVPRLKPSLGFVTAQEIQNTTNNDKKQRRNLDSGAFRPRVMIMMIVIMMVMILVMVIMMVMMMMIVMAMVMIMMVMII